MHLFAAVYGFLQPGFPDPVGAAIYSFFGQSFTAPHPKSNFLTSKFTIYEKLTDEARVEYYTFLDALDRSAAYSFPLARARSFVAPRLSVVFGLVPMAVKARVRG